MHVRAEYSLHTPSPGQPRVQNTNKAQNNLSPDDLFFLGACYAIGIKNLKDTTLAMEYFKKAADAGLVGAQHTFAKFHLENKAPFSDSRIGLDYMMKAAQNGHLKAQLTCATYFEERRAYPTALTFFQLCADQHNNVSAQFKTGRYYAIGRGTEVNLKTSFDYIEKAAQQDLKEALNRLGLCYLYGYGTDPSARQAISCFVKAAEKNDRHAHYNLGLLYQCGVILNDAYLLKPDLQKASHYFRQSAKLGYLTADKAYNDLYCYVKCPETPPKPDLTDEFELVE